MKEQSTWHLTSPKFTGEITLIYDQELRLSSMKISADLTGVQHSWFTSNLPPTLPELKKMLKDSHSEAVLTQVKFQPTFDQFWNLYDDKQLSSKKRAGVKWHSMPKNEQLKAYNYIQTYFSGIPSGTRKKFAETYLNAELWNN
jgi:hypothetical protein